MGVAAGGRGSATLPRTGIAASRPSAERQFSSCSGESRADTTEASSWPLPPGPCLSRQGPTVSLLRVRYLVDFPRIRGPPARDARWNLPALAHLAQGRQQGPPVATVGGGEYRRTWARVAPGRLRPVQLHSERVVPESAALFCEIPCQRRGVAGLVVPRSWLHHQPPPGRRGPHGPRRMIVSVWALREHSVHRWPIPSSGLPMLPPQLAPSNARRHGRHVVVLILHPPCC